MASYKDQLRDIWIKYRDEVSTDPVDLRQVASWAIEKRLWFPRPVDLSSSLASDLADSLREIKRVDKAGREYRALIPVRDRTDKGLPLFKWADIDDAPRTHVEKGLQQERRSIASDCFALAMKAEHYNEAHPDEEIIQIILDFTQDVEEEKIARGLGTDDDEEAA
jgi:hypothetical protein